MKIIALVPYCPWPADTGTRVEMMKHLDVLREMGECTIVSARSKPVGFGWTPAAIAALQERGFSLLFREDGCWPNPPQLLGILYAAVCKTLRLQRAFGHSNPYHRYAFTKSWLQKITQGFDLCVMQYGFWAGVPLSSPKAIVVHELLSNYHWEGSLAEDRDFAMADLLIVVGHDEKAALEQRGMRSVLWSPPAVAPNDFPVNDQIALIGTAAPQNVEGLRWLEGANQTWDLRIKVYGNLAGEVRHPMFEPVGRYGAQTEPYESCGIFLLTRPDRPGLQIKAVEALANGRAIIARRGSMRGLPEGGGDAWLTVNSPEEMVAAATRLREQPEERHQLAMQAKRYYQQYLDHKVIKQTLQHGYLSLLPRGS